MGVSPVAAWAHCLPGRLRAPAGFVTGRPDPGADLIGARSRAGLLLGAAGLAGHAGGGLGGLAVHDVEVVRAEEADEETVGLVGPGDARDDADLRARGWRGRGGVTGCAAWRGAD